MAKVKKYKLHTRGKKQLAFPFHMYSLKKYPANFLSQCWPVRKSLGVGGGEKDSREMALQEAVGLSGPPLPPTPAPAPAPRMKLLPLCFCFFFRVLLQPGGGHFLLVERLLIKDEREY